MPRHAPSSGSQCAGLALAMRVAGDGNMFCRRHCRGCVEAGAWEPHQSAQCSKVGAWATQAEQALPQELVSSVAEVRAELFRHPLQGEAVIHAHDARCACPRRQEGRGGLRWLVNVQRACSVQSDGSCCQGSRHRGDLDVQRVLGWALAGWNAQVASCCHAACTNR